MRFLRPTTAYKKDLKRQRRRGKALNKLTAAIELLQEAGELPRTYRPHKLSGNWAHVWECHIEPDWLLIYDVDDEEVQLIRTGTHADLFE
jgi:mRNA interferase YafQ